MIINNSQEPGFPLNVILDPEDGKCQGQDQNTAHDLFPCVVQVVASERWELEEMAMSPMLSHF